MAPKGFGDLFKKKAKKPKVVNLNAEIDDEAPAKTDADLEVRANFHRNKCDGEAPAKTDADLEVRNNFDERIEKPILTLELRTTKFEKPKKAMPVYLIISLKY
jgi:hypothetical protein